MNAEFPHACVCVSLEEEKCFSTVDGDGGEAKPGEGRIKKFPFHKRTKKMSKQCCRLRDMTQYEAETLFAYLRLANWLVDERLSHDARLVT